MTITRFFDAASFTPFADDDAAWGGFAFVQPSGIASAESFGVTNVRAFRTIIASGVASLEAFGAPVVPAGLQKVFASGVASSEAFGTPQQILFQSSTAWKKVQLVNPLTNDTSVLFGYTGTAPVTGDWYEYNALSSDGFAVTVNPDGTYYIDGSNNLDPSDSFQGRWYSTVDRAWSALATVTLVSSPFTMGAITIASKEAFGVPAVTAQSGGLVAQGIPSAGAFGNPTLILAGVVRAVSIPSAGVFGTAEVIAGNRIVPLSLASGEAFGSTLMVTAIRAGVIVSAEAFGPVVLTNFTNKLVPLSIPSEEVFGDVRMVVDRVLTTLAIASAESFGHALVFSPGVWAKEVALTKKHWVEETPQ